MFVIELEITTEVKPEQSENAPKPKLVTEVGIVTETKPEQRANA
jgi:hypothetical protein